MNNTLFMSCRWLFPALFILLFLFVLPVNAHVPISAANNDDISHAFSVEKPTKSYVLYGHLHNAGDSGYYQFSMNEGDRLTLSLMIPGESAPVPDMFVMSPGASGTSEDPALPVTVPPGYSADRIKGKKPVTAEYEPFSPAAIYEVASFSENITLPGTYYVAVISPADETDYSIAVGYLEEFTISEWVLIPVNVIQTHLWEGQSLLAILAPFLAVLILGFILTARQKNDAGGKKSLLSWLASGAGLCYLGGSSITLVQMVRALMVTGVSAGAVLTIIFATIPVLLGIWALRIARIPTRHSLKDRMFLGMIGLLGLVFWAGLIIGPVIAFLAAVLPERSQKPVPT
jgi:hypothetical protein